MKHVQFAQESAMTTLQTARHVAGHSAHDHPARFALGLAVAALGAVLLLVGVVQAMAALV